MKWIGKILEGICAVVGALVLSQTPMFMLSYAQRLEGHVAELRVQIQAMEKVAGQTGKSISQYIQKFLSSADSDFHAQGELMQRMVDRWKVLSESLNALEGASVWQRPYVFIKHLDWEIIRATYQGYIPGLTFSVEGIVYGLVGIAMGYVVFYLIKRAVTWPKKEQKKVDA